MAKQTTECGCGGSFDGTPSGQKKHNLSAKHLGWVAGQQKASRAERAAKAPIVSPLRDPESEEPQARPIADIVAETRASVPTEPPATDEQVQAAPPSTPVGATLAEVKSATGLGTSFSLAEARAAVAKYRRYVAYADKPENKVRPENKAKYAAGLAEALAALEAATATEQAGKAEIVDKGATRKGPKALENLLNLGTTND